MLNSSMRMVTVAALATWLAPPAAAQLAGDCSTLEDLKIEDTNLLSSTVVPAADDLPEYCRVLGYVRPAINFESACRPRPGTASSTWPAAARGAASSNPIGQDLPMP